MATYSNDQGKVVEYDDGMKQADRLKKYRSQIETSLKWRRDNYDQSWRDWIELYANNHFKATEIDDFSDAHQISIGVCFSTINIIYPSVSIARPKITVEATHPDLMQSAEVVESVVNYWWKHHGFQDEFRRAVKDYLIIGHGWLKTTYLFKEDEQDMEGEEYAQQLMAQLTEKYTAIGMNPQDEALFATDEEIAQMIPTTKKVIVEDHPSVERVSPFDMVVDPDATCLADARWIAQRIAVPIEEAKKRQDWSPKVRKALASKADKAKEAEGFFADQVDKEQTFVFVYEHYDLVNGTLCTFGMDGDDFLKAPQQIPFVYGHPFTMVRNYEIPEKFYPMGELEVLEPLQMELDLTRSAQLRDLLSHARKYVSRKGSLDQENMERLATARDGELILLEESAPDDVTKALVAAPTMDIPQQTYQMSTVIQDDMTRSSGVSDYAMGAMPEIRRTATEAGIIQDAANSRAADKLAQIELTLAAVARRVVQLGQQFLTQEQVARIEGEDGSLNWVQFDRDAIQGEFDFEIEAGSTQPQNETFRRQSAMQLMDAISSPLFQPQPDPVTGMITPVLDARKVAEYVLRNGFGIKNAQEFLTPPPPPPTIDPMTGQPMPPAGMGMPPGMAPPGAQQPQPGAMPPGGPPEGAEGEPQGPPPGM